MSQLATFIFKTLNRAHFLKAMTGGALAFVLVGCAGPKPPEPVILTITVAASATSNPDARQRPSPVTVRVYELKSTAAFVGADFFSLIEKDQATLSGDLVAKEELVLQPGESRQLQRKVDGSTKSIAVIAAFRDLERAQWRDTIALPAGTKIAMRAAVDEKQIKLSVGP